MGTENSDDSYDLLIVGFGAAGAAAAITAAESGARVLVIEKQRSDAHTPNSRMSGGVYMAVNDVDRSAIYMDFCAGGMVPLAVTRAWAKRAHGLPSWLAKRGIARDYKWCAPGEHTDFDNSDAIDVYRNALLKDGTLVDFGNASPWQAAVGACNLPDGSSPKWKAGPELWAEVLQAVNKRGIRIQWNTAAQYLIQDDNGMVVGAGCTNEGRQISFTARYGVVLSTGGYEFDEDAKRQFLKAPMHFYGNPDNTGDGVRMAQKVGASLWHMNLAIGRGIAHFPQDDGTFLNFAMDLQPGGYVITDKYGRRYANELPQAQMGHAFLNEMTYFDSRTNDFSRIPSYWLFDSRRLRSGALTVTACGLTGVGLYDWSKDNLKEVERGWISTGETPEEAARAAGVLDPAAAANEVARYNEACRTGNDPFGRPAHSLLPIDEPPFYCVPLYAGGSNTCGGPRRDERARVLDAFGKPIPGLFSAGELGQAIGILYPAAGANLSEAFCFGQIAAEEALRSFRAEGSNSERSR